MELDNLKSLWQENDVNIDKNITIDPLTLGSIQKQKAKSALTPLFWARIAELIFHTLALIFLIIFCFYNYNQWPYALSAYMLILFYSAAFTNSVAQLNAIAHINSKSDIISIQSSLAKIQSNRLNFVRLGVLFIPALLSFPVVISRAIVELKLSSIIGFDIIQRTHGKWWAAQLIVFIVMIPLGIWFRNEVSYKNIHKQWVNDLIQKTLGGRVRKAMEYINELETLKNGALQ